MRPGTGEAARSAALHMGGVGWAMVFGVVGEPGTDATLQARTGDPSRATCNPRTISPVMTR